MLWTRLAPEPLAADGGISQGAHTGALGIILDEAMQTPIRQGEELAIPQLAHSVHVDVQNLDPGREYWYRFSAGSQASEPGRTKTLPAVTSQAESIRFVTASCQNYTHGYFIAL